MTDLLYEGFLEYECKGQEHYLAGAYGLAVRENGTMVSIGTSLFSVVSVDIESFSSELERIRNAGKMDLERLLANLHSSLSSFMEIYSEEDCRTAMLDSGLAYVDEDGFIVWD